MILRGSLNIKAMISLMNLENFRLKIKDRIKANRFLTINKYKLFSSSKNKGKKVLKFKKEFKSFQIIMCIKIEAVLALRSLTT